MKTIKEVIIGAVKSVMAQKTEKFDVKIAHVDGCRGHYNRITKAIVIDKNADRANVKGKWCTLYHELGHHKDWELGLVSESPVFNITLKRELGKMVNDVDMNQLCKQIRQEPRLAALSDMLSGYTLNKYKFRYKHSNEYWQSTETRLASEAFAHFHEAHCRQDEFKTSIYKKYLPESYEMFFAMIAQ